MSGDLFQTLGAGGPIILVLLVLSIASLSLIAVKTAQLWRCKSGRARRREAFEQWRSGDREAATRTLAEGSSPADRVAAHAMAGLRGGLDRKTLEGDLIRRGNEEMEAMTSHIRLLELIAMISPLLGLLGTVLGMITSFQQLALAEGAANASVLAGGIWQALLTTAAGLMVAIPAAIGATLLSVRAESAGTMIESAVGELFMVEDSRNRPG
ncbi:MAG: MotA/TolQ/ExbB proton channel family protein [Paracoccaceae bacterium]